MKALTKICAALAIIAGSHLLYANNNTPESPAKALESENYLEESKAWSGMFFNSENVVEEYEYDDAYVLLYDDADANMFNVEICVDLETYQSVQQAIKSGKPLVGSLVLNDDYSFDGTEVFTFMPEPEFEIAQESANL